MDKIVVFFQPFSVMQNIAVYKNNEMVHTTQVDIERVSNVIKGLASQYDIKEVDLKGNQEYLEKFKAEILTNYSLLNVNII